MGFLSKIWKGVKKGVKKIGKGIKKVFGKVMKAVGKLGIVGQVGMMFLMPYAMQGIGSLFGTAGKLSTWSSKLMGPNSGFFKDALGRSLDAINKAGTWVGKTYTSVSSQISGAIDSAGNFLKGRGWTPTPDGGWIGSGQLPGKDFDFQSAKLEDGKWIDKLGGEATGEQYMNRMKQLAGDSNMTVKLNLDTVGMPDTSYKPFDKGSLTQGFELDHNKYLTELSSKKNLTDVGDLGLLDKMKKDWKEFDLYDWSKNQIQVGATQGLQTGTRDLLSHAITGGPDTPNYYTTNIPNIMDIGRQSNANIFNEVDLFHSKKGNSWQATGMLTSAYTSDILNPGVPAWQSYMNTMAGSLDTGLGR